MTRQRPIQGVARRAAATEGDPRARRADALFLAPEQRVGRGLGVVDGRLETLLGTGLQFDAAGRIVPRVSVDEAAAESEPDAWAGSAASAQTAAGNATTTLAFEAGGLLGASGATIARSGVYLVQASADVTTASGMNLEVELAVNGTRRALLGVATASIGRVILGGSALLPLVEGDAVAVRIVNAVAAARTIASAGTRFAGQRIA